jgi:hypothetical protein
MSFERGLTHLAVRTNRSVFAAISTVRFSWILLKKSPFSRFRLSLCNNDPIIEQKLDQLIADKRTHERIFLANLLTEFSTQSLIFAQRWPAVGISFTNTPGTCITTLVRISTVSRKPLASWRTG